MASMGPSDYIFHGVPAFEVNVWSRRSIGSFNTGLCDNFKPASLTGSRIHAQGNFTHQRRLNSDRIHLTTAPPSLYAFHSPQRHTAQLERDLGFNIVIKIGSQKKLNYLIFSQSRRHTLALLANHFPSAHMLLEGKRNRKKSAPQIFYYLIPCLHIRSPRPWQTRSHYDHPLKPDPLLLFFSASWARTSTNTTSWQTTISLSHQLAELFTQAFSCYLLSSSRRMDKQGRGGRRTEEQKVVSLETRQPLIV